MGFLAPVLGSIGSAAGTAAGAVGSGLADVAGSLGGLFGGGGGAAAGGAADTAGALAGGSGAGSALTNIAHAITGAGAPSESGYLASLGQAVPEGVDLVGPSSTFTGGSGGAGFLHGLVQGFAGTAQQLASPSAATSAGTGLGQLFSALQNMPQAQMPQQPGQTPQPVVTLGDVGHAATRLMSPGPSGEPSTGPIMNLIGQLFKGF
jgi:hypothetical protein